jgi:hypothetical protein
MSDTWRDYGAWPEEQSLSRLNLDLRETTELADWLLGRIWELTYNSTILTVVVNVHVSS